MDATGSRERRSCTPDEGGNSRGNDVMGYEADDEVMTDDDSDNDFEALLLRKTTSRSLEIEKHARKNNSSTWWWLSRLSKKAILCAFITALVVIVLINGIIAKRRSHPANTPMVIPKSSQSFIDFTCPATVERSKNDKSDNFDYYSKDDKKMDKNDMKLDDFRSIEKYDGWGISFQEVKRLLRQWKMNAFVANLQPGDKIYESACGAGLNLLLTADILHEAQQNQTQHQRHDDDADDDNITPPITIYGNDYMSSSIKIANQLWDMDDASKLATKGKFCTGDSTQLDFVPSNSFDLAFVGYIDPIMDPLGLMPEDTPSVSRIKRNSKANCQHSKKVAAQEQAVQDDWWASWVEELIRIAKPGKPVVVENNGYAICTEHSDWGGVDKEFWKDAIETRGWDVDPESLVIEDMPRSDDWRTYRYHVMMRKNP